MILVHPDDLQHLELDHDELVTVRSETGCLTNILARGYAAIRPGNALRYYPEANELVSRRADPDSKTPAFKGVVIQIEKQD